MRLYLTMSLSICTRVSRPSDAHTQSNKHTEPVVQKRTLTCHWTDEAVFLYCLCSSSSVFVNLSSIYFSSVSANHFYCSFKNLTCYILVHLSVLVSGVFDLQLHLNPRAHGQCTVANKFLIHPVLLALMCNLRARGILPRGNRATAHLCVSVCIFVKWWPVSRASPPLVPIRRLHGCTLI